jgi:hypothetical protein
VIVSGSRCERRWYQRGEPADAVALMQARDAEVVPTTSKLVTRHGGSPASSKHQYDS